MTDNGFEREIERLEAVLKNIQQKYVPVSEERINKLWGAVRETIDTYSGKLAAYQEGQRLQNEKIATLASEVQELKQQVILLSALTQGGMPVPKE